MRFLERASGSCNGLLARVAGVALVAMMLITVGNMIMRVIYVPFGATAEVVGWLSAVCVAFALGYTQVGRGHVAISLLVSRFPPRLAGIVDTAGFLVNTVIFGLVAWKMAQYGLHLQQLNVLSESLGIVFYPLVYLVALGFAGLALALLVDFLKSLAGVAKR